MPRELVTHVLVIEGDNGLTLVDTGFGTADVEQGARRLGRAFAAMIGPCLDADQTAVNQVRALGYDPTDAS